jgi:hypothetical protein
MVIDEDLVSDPVEITEVDRFRSDLETAQHDGVQRWSRFRSYASLQGATREGEQDREEGRHTGDERRARVGSVVFFSSPWGPLYRGKGQTLPLHQARWD